MKKLIYFIITLFILSCSSVDNRPVTSETEKSILKEQILNEQSNLVEIVKENNEEKFRAKIASTLRNDIMLSLLKKYDMSKVLLVFSDEVEILSKGRAKSLALLNYEMETYYIDIIWGYIDNEWKIISVESQ